MSIDIQCLIQYLLIDIHDTVCQSRFIANTHMFALRYRIWSKLIFGNALCLEQNLHGHKHPFRSCDHGLH